MPFAFALSGWSAAGALTATAALFCYSGSLIVSGFDKLDSGTPQTYPALGAYLVVLSSLFHLRRQQGSN